MERINAYKTTDGEVFHNRKEAKAHQKNLDLLDGLRKLAEDTAGAHMDANHLGDWLTMNYHYIETLLKGGKVDPIGDKNATNERVEKISAEIDSEINQVLEEIIEPSAA